MTPPNQLNLQSIRPEHDTRIGRMRIYMAVYIRVYTALCGFMWIENKAVLELCSAAAFCYSCAPVRA